ncbi:MAG: putative fumarate hydratase, mitochondrial precursor [Verrucomicrobiales bacterium]|nr:putative fumarate hydratase, mitochondrial precursor [Verrucomicrobiales bacterium]
MGANLRIEKDSMGEMQVPSDAYYGAQTARAIENFPISNLRFPRGFISAIGLIKRFAATVNVELGELDANIAHAIETASLEVADGKWDHQFVVDIFQTGSGTSTNMNANEVIAHRASELLGTAAHSVHPNDHVNRGQSSNDVIPSAIHLAALMEMKHKLLPALAELRDRLSEKEDEFDTILKIGRTHLQDATPMRLGQEFSGYATQIANSISRIEQSMSHLQELALGGTAIGTGLNTHPLFAEKVIAALSEATGLPLREARNHFEAQASRDACVEASGALKTVATSLIKIANDIRFLGSGPRLGYGELQLPSTQPGSSIMPGKVNPVMCEMLIQVGAQVIGNDATITFGNTFGNFELNVMLPVIGFNLLQSIEILANGSLVFARRCVAGLTAEKTRCEGNIERSLAMATALAPVVGYDQAALVAKNAYETNRTVREVAREKMKLSPEEIDRLLEPRQQTGS